MPLRVGVFQLEALFFLGFPFTQDAYFQEE